MDTAEKTQRYILPTYGQFPIEITHGKGTEVWDTKGQRYLDFCTGIAVCGLGHAHPELTQTLKDQAEKILHCSNLYPISTQADLAELIVEECVKLPGKVFFSNSGAEANDGLIKSARRYGHAKPKADGSPRHEIITFKNSFHGRTMGSMFATGQDVVHEGFTPIPQGYKHLPYNDITALEAGISEDSVAVLLEPIQGEGGVNPATKKFLHAVEALCKKHDLLLFFDEVQVGFGRCGDMAAWKVIAPEIQPDGISWAKGMGGGVPIGGFWLSDRSIDKEGTTFSSLMGAKSHGSTYGGNPLVSAVALKNLQIILAENLPEAAHKKGNTIKEAFATWNHPAIHEVRGHGLLLGIHLKQEHLHVAEGSTPALTLCLELNATGLLTVPAGPNTLRWLPPLTVSDAEIQEAFGLLQQAIEKISVSNVNESS